MDFRVDVALLNLAARYAWTVTILSLVAAPFFWLVLGLLSRCLGRGLTFALSVVPPTVAAIAWLWAWERLTELVGAI
jgi:hypothetical protein